MWIRARPNGSLTDTEAGPNVYFPRCRHSTEYDTFSWFWGGIPVTTTRAGLPSDGDSESSISRKGAVPGPLFWTVSVATTRVPGKTRTEERWRWISILSLFHWT